MYWIILLQIYFQYKHNKHNINAKLININGQRDASCNEYLDVEFLLLIINVKIYKISRFFVEVLSKLIPIKYLSALFKYFLETMIIYET